MDFNNVAYRHFQSLLKKKEKKILFSSLLTVMSK